MKKDKALKIAESVLEQVGGKQNIAKVLHCQTRLRFNLKDESIANHEKIEAVQGVLGVVRAGGQVQIVIGPEAVSYTHLDVYKRQAFPVSGAVGDSHVSPGPSKLGALCPLWRRQASFSEIFYRKGEGAAAAWQAYTNTGACAKRCGR